MKAIVINEYGGKENLTEEQIDRPEPEDNEVVIEIYSTSVNPIDWKLREGYLKDMLPYEFPIILGWDAAGVVKETGKDVHTFKKGDRVFTRTANNNRGTNAEYVKTTEKRISYMPEDMSFDEAAAVPLAGQTAWQCLVEFAEMKSGDKVLIHGAGGGVGHFAVQIAKSFGAHVIATASAEKADLLKELGADEIIDYRTEDFEKKVSDADIVLDTIGGEVLEKSFTVLKKGGKLPSIAGQPEQEQADKYGVKAGFVWLEESGERLQKLADLYVQGKLKVVIDSRFPLSEEGVQQAHAASEKGRTRGKIVIQVKS